MHLAMRHSLFWEKHEISMSIMVLAARQPERMGAGGGRVVQVKRAVCVIFSLLFSLIFRICHGRRVAIPGTQSAASPTTASQTPKTSPALWWSSGSKLDLRVCLDHKDTALLWTDLNYTERPWSLLCIMIIRVGVWYCHLDLRIQWFTKSLYIHLFRYLK